MKIPIKINWPETDCETETVRKHIKEMYLIPRFNEKGEMPFVCEFIDKDKQIRNVLIKQNRIMALFSWGGYKIIVTAHPDIMP